MTFWLGFLVGVVTTFALSAAYVCRLAYLEVQTAKAALEVAEALQDFPRNMDMPPSDWRKVVAAAELVRDVEIGLVVAE